MPIVVTMFRRRDPQTRQRARRWPTRAASGVGVLVAAAVPLVATGVWVMLSDPAVAADVAVEGDLWPLAEAIAEALGRAWSAFARYL